MTNPSPLVLINSQSQLPNGVNVTAGSTVTIALASTFAVFSWDVLCIGTDDLNTAAAVNATLIVNSASQTATFTAPALVDGYGSALIFKSVVNNGIDINGVAQPYLSTTFGVYVPAFGLRMGAQNETNEGNATYGWLTKFNEAIRTGAYSGGLLFGDVTGASADNEVSLLQGNPLSVSGAITTNYVLTWNGSAWVAEAAQGGTLNGDVTGPYNSNTVINIHGASVPAAGSLTPGNTLQVSGSNSLTYAPIALNGGATVITGQLPTFNQVNQALILSGDCNSTGGTTGGATTSVVGIRGGLIPTLPVSDGYLNYTGSAWQFSAITIPTSLPPSGAAGGDLSGTYPNPTVAKINGSSVSASPSANQVLVATSSSATTWEQIANAQVSSTAAIAYSKLNLTGDIVNADISSSAAVAVSKLAAGTSAQLLLNNSTPTPTWTTLSGDVSITSAGVSKVIGIDGYTISGGPTTGQVLEYNGTNLVWSLPGTNVTWADDLVGSTNTAQYVAAISGNAGAGGVIPVNATQLQFGSSQSNGTIGQASLTSTSITNGQSGQAIWLIAQNGQAATGASNAGGTGGRAWLLAGNGGTSGSSTGGTGGQAAISSGAGSGGSANGSISLQIAQTELLNISGSSLGTVQFTNPLATPTIGQTAQSSTSSGSGAYGANFIITAQNGQAATGASHNGGNGGSIQLSAGLGGTSGSAAQGSAGSIYLEVAGVNEMTISNAGVNIGSLLAGIVKSDSSGNLTSIGGTSAQFLINNSTPTPTWATMSGDVKLNSTGGTTVVGIDGYLIQGTGSSGQYLALNGSSEMVWTTPAGSSSVTGTGLWYSTSGTLNAASITLTGDVSEGALSGSNVPLTVTGIQGNTFTSGSPTKGQFVVAKTTSSYGPVTLSGDITESATTPGALTLTAIDGYSLPSPSGTNTILTYNAGTLTWGSGGGGGVTWANDLVGSTNTDQYVAAISGNAAAGGTIPFNATTLQWGAAQTTFAINQATGGSSASPVNGATLAIAAQAGQANTSGGVTGKIGGPITITAGPGANTGSATGGAGGAVTIAAGYGGASGSGTNGVGGNLTVISGGAGGSGVNSGNLYLATGTLGASGGTAGSIFLQTGTSSGQTTQLTVGPTGTLTAASLAGNGDGYVAVHNSGVLYWSAGTSGGGGGSGITALTGDVTASGTGSVAATIATMQATNTVTKTSNYTINSGSPLDFQILANPSGAFNLTLPAPANGMVFHVWDISGTMETNNVTLVRHGSEKISGVAASRALQTNWGHWMITTNGTDWFVG